MKQQVDIIGIPMDLGQQRRGVDMGPSAIRYAGLKNKLEELGYFVADQGDIHVAGRDNVVHEDAVNYLPTITKTLTKTFEMAKESVEREHFPIFLGGDHSIAIGTIAGVSAVHPIGVIWVDAHADFNTMETSPSGNIHGMPFAAVNGYGHKDLISIGGQKPKVDPKNCVLIGARDLDPGEKQNLRDAGLKVFTMRDIDELGIASVALQTLKYLHNVDKIHVSFDLDAIDPSAAPGVGTPVPGGLSYREAHLLMEILADTKRISSVDIVELNPILDEHNKTGIIAVELLSSLLGKSIL